jgi:hypothetical protein
MSFFPSPNPTCVSSSTPTPNPPLSAEVPNWRRQLGQAPPTPPPQGLICSWRRWRCMTPLATDAPPDEESPPPRLGKAPAPPRPASMEAVVPPNLLLLLTPLDLLSPTSSELRLPRPTVPPKLLFPGSARPPPPESPELGLPRAPPEFL